MRGATKRDPVCGVRINRNKAHVVVEHKGREYLLFCPKCQSEFSALVPRSLFRLRELAREAPGGDLHSLEPPGVVARELTAPVPTRGH